MKTAAAVKFFGSVKDLAEKLEISDKAIYQWGEDVPEPRNFQIEVLSGGQLKARDDESQRQEAIG
jgi:hypothetical protein